MNADRTPEVLEPCSDATSDIAKEPLIRVRIWGVRGSIPTPVAGILKFGGNTPCLELNFAGPNGSNPRIILDAGTGIRNLGLELVKTKSLDQHFHVFLTHFHWDHVQGLPFFPPLYDKSTTITFYSSRTPEQLREILWGQMVTPYFPVRFEDLAASVNFVQVGEEPLLLGEVEVSSFCLTHPQGSSGFRIHYAGRTVVYATDHEHGQQAADMRLLFAAKDADVLFYDAQYTPEEYPSRKGWGHGTWLEATRVGAEARVKKLVLFHHDPGHDDARMDEILVLAQTEFRRTVAAMEGETILVV